MRCYVRRSSAPASKIVTIRGPETMFQDGNIWKSIGSIDTSFKDAYSVMTPEGRMLADQSLAQRNALLHDPENGVMTQMNKWLETKGLKPEDVVYLRPDGQLKYPTKDVPLTGEDLKQYELAKEVRAKMADLMRAGHRTDGSLPGNFEPSISNRVDPGRNVAKPVEMPAATGKSITDASGASITPTEHGHIKRSADGKMQIRNDAEDYTRTYDANGRIVESVQSGRKQEYFYDTNGNLKDIRFGDGSVANRDPNGDWTHRSIGANKQIVEQSFHRGTVIADSDGTIRMLDGTGMLKYENMTVFNTRGETIHYVNGRARYDVSLAKESRDLNRLATESFTEPQQLARFNKFREEFEAAAVTRGITPEQTAQFYKQINRLLDKNPNAVLTQSERTQLAEQLMAHSARPDTVDQGAFSTCNVTTLEVRNYSRNPAANAQLVADIATTGKFMTNNGIEIDMTQVAGGIKPDHHALASLKRQAEGLDVVKKDGGRDWASQITETAMVNAHWQANPHMVVNGRLTGAWDLAYDKSGLVIGRFNDRMAKLPKLYDKDGKELTHYTDGMKLFDKKGRELTDFDPNNIVYDNGRNLRGMVDTDKILTFTDAAGKRLKAREVGANGFDVNGEPVYRHVPAGSGELKYQNSGTRTAREQVMFNDGARWRQLLDESGDKMDAPGIPTDKLSRANTQATDTPDQSYVIQAAESTYRYSNVSQVSSADELGKTLEEMIRLKQMPAVLQVHTGNTPFSSGLGIDQAFGIGGWHVVNIHDYDPVTRTVKFTNQWGSGSDRMGPQGYSLDKFYKSMNESKLHKFMSSTPGRYLQGTAAAVAAGGYGYFLLKDR